MVFCPACGYENPPDQNFCNNCGSPLTPGTKTGQTPSPAPVQTPATPAANITLQSRNIKIVIGIVAVIAIVGAVVLIGLPAIKNSQPGPGADPSRSISTSTFSPTQVPSQVQAPVSTTAVPTPVTTVPTPTPSLQQVQPATKTYTSSRFGFSMDYPSNWEVNEKNTLETPSLTRYNVVEFYSPSINRCDSDQIGCAIVKTTMMVEIETQPNTKEIADYFVPEVARITRETGVQITKTNAIFELSGVKAYRLDYSAQYNKNDIKLLSAYTLINDKVYIVTYRAYAPVRLEEDQFEKYYNTAMDMFKSFDVQGAVTVLQ